MAFFLPGVAALEDWAVQVLVSSLFRCHRCIILPHVALHTNLIFDEQSCPVVVATFLRSVQPDLEGESAVRIIRNARGQRAIQTVKVNEFQKFRVALGFSR